MQWLKEIPSHWDFLTGKKIYLRNDGGVWGIDPLNDGKDTIVLRSTEQTVDGKLVIENPAKRYLSEKEKQGSLLEENDLIITKSSGSPAHIGKTSIINKEIAQLDCSYSNFIQRIRIKGCPMYYWFVFNSTLIKTQFDILTTTTTGLKNISTKIIDRVLLPLPPLSEQEQIVRYLEDKTSKIDAYVSEKEKEILLLQELKQKTIADAVTKGLNPDVKMKDSSSLISTFCPASWKIVRNKSFMSLTGVKVGNRADEYVLLSLTTKGIIVRDLESGKGKFPKDFDTYQFVRKGELVFCLFDIDETPRTVGLVDTEGMLTGAYTALKVNTEIALPEYIYNYYLCVDNIKALKPYYSGLRKTVRADKFLQIYIPLPPLDEQRAIVSYIEEKCQKIDSLTTELQSEIDYLKEYKQRLIADCVTGQINVQKEVT